MSVIYQIYADTTSGYLQVYQSNDSSDGTVLSPHLKRGANQADGFDFTMLPGNPAYDSLEELKSFIYVLRDNKYVFRGRVKDIKTDIFKQREVSCEGDLSFLGDSVQSPNTFVVISEVGDTGKKIRQIQHDGNVEMTVSQYFQSVIQGHNAQMDDGRKQFQIGQITVAKRNSTEKFEVSSYTDTSSVISSDLLDKYGGVIRTRYVNNVPYIDWLDSYTDTGSQDIKFGVNMLELDEEQPNDDIWTVLLPIGKDKLTIESVNSGNKFLTNANAINKYGRIVHYQKFDDAKKAADLLSKAQEYMNKHCKIYPDNLIVKAVDLKLIGEASGPLQLGDKIKVVSSPHGISTTMACIEEDVDIQNPENSTYTIGTIMPPDDTKKTSMSSHQATRQRQAVRTAIQTGDAIDGLERDMDVVANNVNVNAKNIAINAENIAVNAENIAINAENITIAAQTIDVQATALSVRLGDVEDDVKTTIETTAEGLKTTIGSQMSGLTHTIELLPSGYTSVVTDSEGRIKSEIVRAENSIKATFNDELYNETTGLATVLRGEISASAEELRSDYTRDITDAEGRITEAYGSSISQTATEIRTEVHHTLYGDGGTSADPKKGSIVEEYRSSISQTAAEIRSDVSKILYGDGGTSADPKKGSIVEEYRSSISQTAAEIRSDVSTTLYGSDGTGGIVAEYKSIIQQTSNQIKLKVFSTNSSKQLSLSFISLTDNKIVLSSENIDLRGYVTVTDLNATNARISNLVSGQAAATSIISGKLKSVSSLEIGDTNNASTLKYRGYEYKDILISMGSVASRLFLGYTTSGYSDTVDLAHSHQVTVNNDGTVTLGAVSKTGGSFRIADTKAYKDGVSAAINSVTISELRRQLDENGDQIADTYYHNSGNTYHTITVHAAAVASNSKIKTQDFVSDVTNVYNAVTVNSIVRQTDSSGNQVQDTYNESTHNKTVHLIAKASNGNTKTQDIVVYGTEPYNAGKNSVSISYITRESNNPDTYDSATHNTTAHLIARASNGETKTEAITVYGTSAFADGKNSVTVTSVGYADGVDGPTYLTAQKKLRLQLTGKASNGATKNEQMDISATEPYNSGRNSVAINEIKQYQSATYDSTNIRMNVFTEAVASNDRSKKETLYVNAVDAYNAGYTKGWNDADIDKVVGDDAYVGGEGDEVNKVMMWVGVTLTNGKFSWKKIEAEDTIDTVIGSLTIAKVTVYSDKTAAVTLKFKGLDKYAKTISTDPSHVDDFHT